MMLIVLGDIPSGIARLIRQKGAKCARNRLINGSSGIRHQPDKPDIEEATKGPRIASHMSQMPHRSGNR